MTDATIPSLGNSPAGPLIEGEASVGMALGGLHPRMHPRQVSQPAPRGMHAVMVTMELEEHGSTHLGGQTALYAYIAPTTAPIMTLQRYRDG